MKNSPLTTILLAILGLSAIASLILCWSYISNTRGIRNLQRQATQISQNDALIGALAQETVAYSTKNPAMAQLLQSFNIQAPRTGAPPASATAPANSSGK